MSKVTQLRQAKVTIDSEGETFVMPTAQVVEWDYYDVSNYIEVTIRAVGGMKVFKKDETEETTPIYDELLRNSENKKNRFRVRAPKYNYSTGSSSGVTFNLNYPTDWNQDQ